MSIQSTEQRPVMLHSIFQTIKRIILFPCDLLSSNVVRSSAETRTRPESQPSGCTRREKTRRSVHICRCSPMKIAGETTNRFVRCSPFGRILFHLRRGAFVQSNQLKFLLPSSVSSRNRLIETMQTLTPTVCDTIRAAR